MTIAYSDTTKIHQLKADIANCKHGDLDVGEFYSKLKNLWNKLTNLTKIPVCTCNDCKCEARSEIISMYEAYRAHQFLMGLNDDLYSTLRSQIVALDTLPPLDKIFNMTQQEENHEKVMMTWDTRSKTAVAYAAREQPTMVEKRGCKMCGRYGHEEAICYEVIGYPPVWGTRRHGRGSHRGRNNGGGRGGGRINSYGRESAAATLHHKKGPNAGSGPGSNEGAQIAVPGLSLEQVERLLCLIDTPKPGYEKLSGKALRMLDNGASTHMVGDVKLVSNLQKISRIAIGLPNGDCTVALNAGLMALGDGIKLDNVLCVLNSDCNLVSVSKLCK